MKAIKSKKISAALVAGTLTASMVFGGLAGAFTLSEFERTTRFVNALESKYDFAISESQGKTYYAAPDGKDKEDGGKGTEESPYSLFYILGGSDTPLSAGDTVLVKPGTYEMPMRLRIPKEIGGEYNKYITVKNASTTEKAILDFSKHTNFDGNHRGVQIDSDYWYFYGLDICGAGDNGMYIGGSYNVIENCEFYNNRDSGLQLGRSESALTDIEDWPSYNLIKNCTSHNNYDNETYGENADGFAAKLTIGYGNIFDGCIAYRNSDDGWDLFAKVDSGNIGAVILYNCVAFENGYIEETQATFNKRFPTFNSKLAEDNTNSFKTRDGDGNGFKLGGSVMEGDVYLYNCLAFNNRMHGVTDNSNPGVLSVKNVTAYNNGAEIDNNPSSPTFGHIIKKSTATDSENTYGNINLSRQTYSYNLLSHILSVSDATASMCADEYRGSIEYSYLDMANMTDARKFTGCVEGSDRTEDYAVKGDKVSAIGADIFAQLPINWSNPANSALSGKENVTVHKDYRNADGSVNMGNMLKITSQANLFGDEHKIGADLSQDSWDKYTHYSYFNASNAESAEDAAVKSALYTLDLNTNVNATFQDFDLTVKMEDVVITWASSDTSVIDIKTDTATSVSGTHDARAIVYRGSENKQVTLTATVTHKMQSNLSETKEFVITVMADKPTIGNAVIEGVEDGLVIYDQYDFITQPAVTVQNAADYNGKLLDSSLYTVETTVMYTSDKEITPVKIHHFTPNVAGIYNITYTVKLNNSNKTKDFTYTIYVASPTASVNFTDTPYVSVNKNGYTISGGVNNATGKLYAMSSATEITDITAQKIIEDGVGYEFRAENIAFNFENSNSAGYYIYYVMCNVHGDVTSEVGKVAVKTKDIANVADFKSMLKDNNSSTIYLLKADLDLSGETDWTSVTSQKKSFKGLLNGLGHTISGLKVSSDTNEYASLFYRLEGGTIENIKFENFEINGLSKGTSAANKVGIVATTKGGYLYNIAMKNIYVSTKGERAGALVGQIDTGELFVEQVSITNDARYATASGVTEENFALANYYALEGEGENAQYVLAEEFESGKQYYTRIADFDGKRVAAIIGYIQAASGTAAITHIDNVYVNVYIGTGTAEYQASVVGAFDDRDKRDYLSISNVVSVGVVNASKYVGGIIGSSNNTGAGTTRISNCVFVGDVYYGGGLTALTAPEKNCSGIVGKYSATADCVVSNCYAKFEDHNSDHQVTGEIVFFGNVEELSFWTTKVGLSTEKWTICESGNKVVPPYATLNFLGNWN